MSSARILKARAVLKTLVGNLASRLPKRKAHDFAWDGYVCDNIDPELLFADPEHCSAALLGEYADYKASLEQYNNDTSGPDLYRSAGLM